MLNKLYKQILQLYNKKHKGKKTKVTYIEEEKLLLVSLVDKYSVVENKNTDAPTMKHKKEAWRQIAKEYNAQSNIIGQRRTDKQLKKLWINLKQRW